MGFDTNFIPGTTIPLPTLNARTRLDAFDNGRPIEHTRFSIVFNQNRRLATLTAHNIDGQTAYPKGTIPRKDRFRFDVTVPNSIQTDNDQGYYKNPYDRGHLVRRVALHWGDEAQSKQADAESYYWTNIAPQHERLHDTAWGKIEDWMLALSNDQAKRVSVFTGPVFTPEDPEIVNRPNEPSLKIPAGFWKILALKHDGDLRAAAFVVWQRDFAGPHEATFDPVLEQVRLSTVEVLTGLSFGDLRHVDPMRFHDAMLPMGTDATPEELLSLPTTPIRQLDDILLSTTMR